MSKALTLRQYHNKMAKIKLSPSKDYTIKSELYIYSNFLISGILELKTMKDEKKIIEPLAKVLGAIYKLSKLLDNRFKILSLDLNFYTNLLAMEDKLVDYIEVLTITYAILRQTDKRSLNSILAHLQNHIENIIAISNITMEDICAKVLAIYGPISVYKGNKTTAKLKSLKKKSEPSFSPILNNLSSICTGQYRHPTYSDLIRGLKVE